MGTVNTEIFAEVRVGREAQSGGKQPEDLKSKDCLTMWSREPISLLDSDGNGPGEKKPKEQGKQLQK